MNQIANASTINPTWASIIPSEEWAAYLEAIRVLRKTRAPFVLGGAFGLAGYTGRWRNTKDLDFFVPPADKDEVVDALNKAGFEDFYSRLPYDRGWIYRATKGGVLVDVIWQTPNRRSQVDPEWFTRAREVTLRNEKLAILPAEELLTIKLYVLQRDRCDWPDLINLLCVAGPDLDWQHVLNRLGPERALLAGLLQVFNWLAPRRARALPKELREMFHLSQPAAEELALPENERIALLDSRPWFAALQPEDKPMQL